MEKLYNIKKSTLVETANAIREKIESSDKIGPLDFPDAIRSIEGGGDTILSNAYTCDMHNRETDIPNMYIDATGKQVSYNNWTALDYIKIPDGAKYVAIINGSEWGALYNQSKSFISRCSNGITVIPENAYYVRCSNYTSSITNLRVAFLNDYSDEQILLINSEKEEF